MYTVSLNSIRFRLLIVTFACLPLLALLLSSVLSRSGLTQTDERGTQATPPALVVSEPLPPRDLPMMMNDGQLAAGALPLEKADLCTGLDQIPDPDLCTRQPNKLTSGHERHPPTRRITGQRHTIVAPQWGSHQRHSKITPSLTD